MFEADEVQDGRRRCEAQKTLTGHEKVQPGAETGFANDHGAAYIQEASGQLIAVEEDGARLFYSAAP